MCCIKFKVIQLRVRVKLACQSSTSVSGYISYLIYIYTNSCTFGSIETKITVSVRIDINDGYILVNGQGLLVYGQGQIRDFMKIRLCCAP